MAPPVIETRAEIEARLLALLPQSPFDHTDSVDSKTGELVEKDEILARLNLKVSHDNLQVPGVRFPLIDELIKGTLLEDSKVHSITQMKDGRTTVCAQMIEYKTYGAGDSTLERLKVANALYNELKKWESVLSHEMFALGRCVVTTRDDLELRGGTRPKGAYCQIAWFFEWVPHHEVFRYKKSGTSSQSQNQAQGQGESQSQGQPQGQDQGNIQL